MSAPHSVFPFGTMDAQKLGLVLNQCFPAVVPGSAGAEHLELVREPLVPLHTWRWNQTLLSASLRVMDACQSV